MQKKNDLVEIWGDVVSIKALVLSILISIVSTMGLYFIAPSDNKSLGLLLGLTGAIIGFIISTVLFKPKRDITVEK